MTPLEWSKSSTERMTWDEALAWCKALRERNLNDWRGPTIQELVTLVNYDRCNPACDLEDTASNGYWSASTYATNPTYAWLVNFYSGIVDGSAKTVSYYVRAVRGGV